MRRHLISSAILLICLVSCARVPERPLSLSEKAPQVISIIPDSEDRISTQPQIIILFSKPVDESTINAESIFLTQGEASLEEYPDSSELYKALEKGKFSTIGLQFSIQQSGQVALVTTDEELEPRSTYSLVVTPRIQSQEHVPLLIDSDQRTLKVVYQTGERGLIDSPMSDSIPVAVPGQPLVPASPLATPSASGVPDSVSQVAHQESATDDPISSGVLENPSEAPPVAPVISFVVLNEIYYDAVGSDTDGALFVELYGTPGLSIAGYKINFVNGSDGKIYDSITLPESAQIARDGFFVIADSNTGSSAETHVSRADLIDNFDPQNGPDAVQLMDTGNHLIDAVGYGEGILPIAENGFGSFEGIAAPDVVNGHSLERRAPGLDTNHNSDDFIERETPNPAH